MAGRGWATATTTTRRRGRWTRGSWLLTAGNNVPQNEAAGNEESLAERKRRLREKRKEKFETFYETYTPEPEGGCSPGKRVLLHRFQGPSVEDKPRLPNFEDEEKGLELRNPWAVRPVARLRKFAVHPQGWPGRPRPQQQKESFHTDEPAETTIDASRAQNNLQHSPDHARTSAHELLIVRFRADPTKFPPDQDSSVRQNGLAPFSISTTRFPPADRQDSSSRIRGLVKFGAAPHCFPPSSQSSSQVQHAEQSSSQRRTLRAFQIQTQRSFPPVAQCVSGLPVPVKPPSTALGRFQVDPKAFPESATVKSDSSTVHTKTLGKFTVHTTGFPLQNVKGSAKFSGTASKLLSFKIAPHQFPTPDT